MSEGKSFTTKIHIDELKMKLQGINSFIGVTENNIVEWAVIIAGLFSAYMPMISSGTGPKELAGRIGIALAWHPVLLKLVKQDATRISMRINEMEENGESILYLHMLCKEVDKVGRGHSERTFDILEEYYDFNEYSRYDL